MEKIEENVFENELDTGLITSTCFISVYNSMNKSKVVEAMHFPMHTCQTGCTRNWYYYLLLTVCVHYSTETQPPFSPLFWPSTLQGKVKWSELKGYSEECISLILFCNIFIDMLLSKPDKLNTRFRASAQKLSWTGDQSSRTVQWQLIKNRKWCSVFQGRVPLLLSMFEERGCPFHCPVMLYKNVSPESVQQFHYKYITCFWMTKTEVLSPICCQNQKLVCLCHWPLMKLLQCW